MWFLSPSGWPTNADSADEEAVLTAAGYVPIDESQVAAAVAAYKAGSPPPVPADFVTVDELQTATSPARAALGAAFDPAQLANTYTRDGRIAIIGDSISSGPITGSPYDFYSNARGNYWHDWWLYLNQQNVRSFGNWAVGAKDLQHCRDVQMPNVLAMKRPPSAVVIAAGTNNWDRPIDDGWAVFLGLVYTIAQRGMRPILTLLPPHNVDNWASSWNAKIRAFAAETGLPVIDRNTPVKGANEDTYAAGMSDDGVHPNSVGHRVIGTAIAADAAVTGAFVPNPPDIAVAAGDTYNVMDALWNTSTGWTFAAGMGQFWGTQNGWPALVFNDFSSAKIATGVFASTNDIEIMMGLRVGAGGFIEIDVQPQDSGGAALGHAIPLQQTFTADVDRYGMVWAPIKAPAGTAKYQLSINTFGTNWIERPTVREIKATSPY